MNIGYRPLLGANSTAVKPAVNTIRKPVIDNRQQLSNVLFGQSKIQTSNISFGWSKGLVSDQEEILDLLTDPLTKNIMVGCHIKPDADATGSAIGIAGILKNLGAQVYPVLDDKVPTNLKQLPTNHRGIQQESFFKTTDMIPDAFKLNNVKKLDVAVLTDCALPVNISEQMLKLASSADKVVIIDHHCGKTASEHYELWLSKLTESNPKFKEDNLLYWCDNERSSASEMVAELDKEIYDEFESTKTDPYHLKKRYNNKEIGTYRYSVAAGILDDSGARLNSLEEVPKFPRASKKIVELDNGDKVSSTEAYYRWLISKAGPKKVNLKQVNNNEQNAVINKQIFSLLSGKSTLENIPIKVPEPNSKYGVLDLRNTNALEQFASTIKSNAKTSADVTHLFKLRAIDKINAGESDLYVIVTKSAETGQIAIGAYSVDNLAKKVIDKLIETGIGEGGGHDCASVIRLNKGQEFNAETREVIDAIVKNHKKELNIDARSNTLRMLSEIVDSQFIIMRAVSENLIQGTDTVLKAWTDGFFFKNSN